MKLLLLIRRVGVWVFVSSVQRKTALICPAETLISSGVINAEMEKKREREASKRKGSVA